MISIYLQKFDDFSVGEVEKKSILVAFQNILFFSEYFFTIHNSCWAGRRKIPPNETTQMSSVSVLEQFFPCKLLPSLFHTSSPLFLAPLLQLIAAALSAAADNVCWVQQNENNVCISKKIIFFMGC